jgi:hypothetical protein
MGKQNISIIMSNKIPRQINEHYRVTIFKRFKNEPCLLIIISRCHAITNMAQTRSPAISKNIPIIRDASATPDDVAASTK